MPGRPPGSANLHPHEGGGRGPAGSARGAHHE